MRICNIKFILEFNFFLSIFDAVRKIIIIIEIFDKENKLKKINLVIINSNLNKISENLEKYLINLISLQNQFLLNILKYGWLEHLLT